MSSDTVIEVTGVWKRYGLPLIPNLRNRWKRLKGEEPSDNQDLWALRGVDLQLKQGETLGIIGRNGAGKSTLLKVLAGVTPPTRGAVRIVGRIFPMIELNAGLHKELSGRENVYLLGAIMGLSRQDVTERLQSILDFSELGDWFEQPVRKYSSGMLARLGFGVAVNVESDILLIDEVMAVGDVGFQKKCLSYIDSLINKGKTVIFVSHSPYAIERVCNNAILINQGEIVSKGKPSDIMTDYYKMIIEDSVQADPSQQFSKTLDSSTIRAGSGNVRVQDYAFLDPETKKPLSTIFTGSPLLIRTFLKVNSPVTHLNLSIRVHDTAGSIVLSLLFLSDTFNLEMINQDFEIDCYLDSFPLVPGSYWLEYVCKDGSILIDHLPYTSSILVQGSARVFRGTGSIGIAYTDTEWSINQAPVIYEPALLPTTDTASEESV